MGQICDTCKLKGNRCYCAPNSTCGGYMPVDVGSIAGSVLSAEQKLAKLISTAINTLESMEAQLYGGEERPNDMMDCGCIDGIYNTWINVLDVLGVEHSFESQPM